MIAAVQVLLQDLQGIVPAGESGNKAIISCGEVSAHEAVGEVFLFRILHVGELNVPCTTEPNIVENRTSFSERLSRMVGS